MSGLRWDARIHARVPQQFAKLGFMSDQRPPTPRTPSAADELRRKRARSEATEDAEAHAGKAS